MSTQFKIDKGIELPKRKAPVSHRKYPWDELEVGDSFFIPKKKIVGIGNIRLAAEKRLNRKFSGRSVVEHRVKGVRVWRTE